MKNKQLSDEEITRKLHAQPQIRERFVSTLSVVEVNGSELKRPDDEGSPTSVTAFSLHGLRPWEPLLSS